MLINLTGDALKLLEDFLHYGKSNQYELADAMYYDYTAFAQRLASIQKAYDGASNQK